MPSDDLYQRYDCTIGDSVSDILANNGTDAVSLIKKDFKFQIEGPKER